MLIQYENKNQIIEDYNSPKINKEETKHIQSIVGSFLYHAQALDYILLPSINKILSIQGNPTEYTKKEAQQILDYVATYL